MRWGPIKGGVQAPHWDSGCGEGLQEVRLGAVAQKSLLREDFFLCHTLILERPEAGLEMVTTDYLIFM